MDNKINSYELSREFAKDKNTPFAGDYWEAGFLEAESHYKAIIEEKDELINHQKKMK